MSYPLLPMGATGSVYVRKQYPALLTDIVRDCTNTIDGLNCFGTLLSSDYSLVEGFKAFDVHGGDTACHIRASMLSELYEYYRQQAKITGKSFLEDEETIELLEKLRIVQQNAQNICSHLTKEKRHPEEFGFEPKRDNVFNVTKLLGWDFDNSTSSSQSDTSSSPSSSGSTGYTSLSSGLTSPSLAAKLSSLSMTTPIVPSALPDSLSSPQWNPGDPRLCVLFLAAAFVLANHKEFTRMGPRIAVRFLPEQAMVHRNSLIEPYWNRENHNYSDFRINRIKDQHCHLQKWISRLSCSFIQSWAERLSLSPATQRMIASATHSSPRQVRVVAAFPAFLILRRVWGEQGWPLLLINRHFCSHGYHIRTYTVSSKVDPPHQDTQDPAAPLLVSGSWKVHPVSLDELQTNPCYKQRPSVAIFGNSLQGSYPEYLEMAYKDDGHHKSVPYHADDTCAEHDEHVKAFMAADHDELSKALLSDHCQHPFRIPPRETEPDEESDAVARGVEDQREQYAGRLSGWGGGGENIGVFCWEHLFAETPDRVALEIASKIDAGDLNLFF